VQRKTVVLALILLGHSRQPIDVEAPLCQIFRQAPAPFIRMMACSAVAGGPQGPFLLLQVPAALDRRGGSYCHDDADLPHFSTSLRSGPGASAISCPSATRASTLTLEPAMRVALSRGHAAVTVLEKLEPLRLVRDAHLRY